MSFAEEATSPLEEITVVPAPTEKRLNQRQLVDYRAQREDCLEWLLTFGKEPQKADGYAVSTVSVRGYRMDQFYRWVWDQENRSRYPLAGANRLDGPTDDYRPA